MPGGFKRSRALWDATTDGGWREWATAIGYELQPIRISKSDRRQALEVLQKVFRRLFALILRIPSFCKALGIFLSNRSPRQWLVLGAVALYYYFVRWIHEALDAGPVVLILTSLTLIFTIGLSDEDHRDGLSAYAVFNKGFEQLMGSIDADSLLAQHVGGGGMMMMNMNHPPENERNNIQQDEPPVANEPVEGEENNNNNNNNNRARKSGKKARRRDLEQRREIRRQREAAMQMDGGNENAVDMQRMIEEQIAAAQNERG